MFYNPLTPHFYIVKLGFTGVDIIFSEAVLTCTLDLCFEQQKKIYHNFSSENFRFFSREKLQYITWACFRDVLLLQQTIFLVCDQIVENIIIFNGGFEVTIYGILL